MAATGDDGSERPKVTERDLQLLAEVLEAARTSCPTAAIAPDAAVNPGTYDEFVIALANPLVRLVLKRLAVLMPDDEARRTIDGNYEWWRGCMLHPSHRYAERRQRMVAFVECLHRLVAADVVVEPWLPIDEAAKRAGVSPWRARKGATRKRDPLPVLRGEDGKPAKPLQARVSDVRAWDKRAAERATAPENAATNAAIPGNGAARSSTGASEVVERVHGSQNVNT